MTETADRWREFFNAFLRDLAITMMRAISTPIEDKQARLRRVRHLQHTLNMRREVFGNGHPTTIATSSRLDAALGLEINMLAMHSTDVQERNATAVAYAREDGRAGFLNRHARGRIKRALKRRKKATP